MTDYLSTFVFAVASVGLWTLRVALTAQGRRLFGSAVAAVEGVTYVGVFSQLVGAAGSPGRLIIYGIGVGTGTFVGLTVDRRLKDTAGTGPLPEAEPEAVDNRLTGSPLELELLVEPESGYATERSPDAKELIL